MIRPRRDEDGPACVEALRIVQATDGYPTAWPADPGGWLSPPSLLAAWVAELDGTVVGHVGADAGDPALAAALDVAVDELVTVTRLFTTPAARGHGLARGLVEAVVAHGNALGRRVGLDVLEQSGAAIALYERLGWTLVGRGRATWRTQTGIRPVVRFYTAPDGG